MEIELLVVPECPHEAAAAELITAAPADTGVPSNTRTVVTSQEQAQRRGFVGSPTTLLNGSDPFADPLPGHRLLKHVLWLAAPHKGTAAARALSRRAGRSELLGDHVDGHPDGGGHLVLESAQLDQAQWAAHHEEQVDV